MNEEFASLDRLIA